MEETGFDAVTVGGRHVLLRCQFPGQSQETMLTCLERLGDEVISGFR